MRKKYIGPVILIAGIVLFILAIVLICQDESLLEFSIFLLIAGALGCIAGPVIISMIGDGKEGAWAKAAPGTPSISYSNNPIGKIINGHQEGQCIWAFDKKAYVTATYSSFPSIGSFSTFKNTHEFGNYLWETTKCKLTSDTIEKIVETSTHTADFNMSAFIDGALTAGAAYGMAKGMSNRGSTATVAVYLKNGNKMLIQFNSIENARKFQNDLFVF